MFYDVQQGYFNNQSISVINIFKMCVKRANPYSPMWWAMSLPPLASSHQWTMMVVLSSHSTNK